MYVWERNVNFSLYEAITFRQHDLSNRNNNKNKKEAAAAVATANDMASPCYASFEVHV